MSEIDAFNEVIKNNMTITLATALKDSVTMRSVSPVFYNGSILIFTSADSKKYQQLKSNPNCCIAAGEFFAEAKAEFLGKTMLPENEKYREVYSRKFPNAFDEGIQFGGRYAEFILLHPFRLSGWVFENGFPVHPFETQIK